MLKKGLDEGSLHNYEHDTDEFFDQNQAGTHVDMDFTTGLACSPNKEGQRLRELKLRSWPLT